jgi:hypothetical protein
MPRSTSDFFKLGWWTACKASRIPFSSTMVFLP